VFDTLLGRRRWIGTLLLAFATGCAASFDDITSKEFKFGQLWAAPPPPMQVLETSTDGYARAKAFTRLDEAKNDPALENKQISMLQQAALADRDPLCRMAAIRTLGRYTDPRAPKILSDVYYSDPPKVGAEYKALIRQQALIALEQTSPGEAKAIFVKAAKQPAGELTGTASRDRMEILDERLAAVRALGKYNSPDSIDTLVGLLDKEKDVAIKQCAAESLKNITKKDIPADGKLWHDYFATGKVPPPTNNSMFAVFTRSDPNPIQPIGNWTRPSTPAPGVTTSTPTPPSSGPTMLPAGSPQSLPQSQPAPSSNINQVQFPTTSATPATTPTSIPVTYGNSPQPSYGATPPAGSYRNAAGELVTPVAMPVTGMPGPSR
jgi:HEAT repeats/PBS lyase HEAT-like repeat